MHDTNHVTCSGIKVVQRQPCGLFDRLQNGVYGGRCNAYRECVADITHQRTVGKTQGLVPQTRMCSQLLEAFDLETNSMDHQDHWMEWEQGQRPVGRQMHASHWRCPARLSGERYLESGLRLPSRLAVACEVVSPLLSTFQQCVHSRSDC